MTSSQRAAQIEALLRDPEFVERLIRMSSPHTAAPAYRVAPRYLGTFPPEPVEINSEDLAMALLAQLRRRTALETHHLRHLVKLVERSLVDADTAQDWAKYDETMDLYKACRAALDDVRSHAYADVPQFSSSFFTKHVL